MSRRRAKSRRSGGTVLILLLGLAVVAAGAVFLYPRLSPSADTEKTELTVRYRADAAASTQVAAPWLEVVNTSDRTVRLTDVVVRYHFTADDGAEDGYAANCVQTSLDCTRITQRVVAGKGDARYLEVGFTRAAGSLEPGKSTEGIGLQLYRLDHRAMKQTDDPSYDAALTRYGTSRKVTAYLDGRRVWGDEPAGAAAGRAGAGGSGASDAAEVPDGVLFDDFHYTGPDDPALRSAGWEARSGAGGPGVADSWSSSAITFPAGTGETGEKAGGDAAPEQVARLRAETDGTKKGTRQAELLTGGVFRTGTLAARVRLSDEPAEGKDGDHIAQSFFAISPDHTTEKYSELDYEYMPNGGWGAFGPRLDTTSWRDTGGDRVTRPTIQKLGGWHTLMITAVDGKTTYSLDGRALFSAGSDYFPREPMGIHFSAWFIDLPFQGPRTWDMEVDWVYVAQDRKVSLEDVEQDVQGFADAGTAYVDTRD